MPRASLVVVTLKGEIDFLESVSFGCRSKCGFGSLGRSAEQYAFFRFHFSSALSIVDEPGMRVQPVWWFLGFRGPNDFANARRQLK